jgi:hypothetical protein
VETSTPKASHFEGELAMRVDVLAVASRAGVTTGGVQPLV